MMLFVFNEFGPLSESFCFQISMSFNFDGKFGFVVLFDILAAHMPIVSSTIGAALSTFCPSSKL
jgi:hypothetical protein